MTLTKTRKAVQNPKSIYRIKIQTMEGDADGWNYFDINFPDQPNRDKLFEVLRYCEVLKRQYPNGRGGGSGFYDSLDFFDMWFNELWNYVEGEYMDSMSKYSLVYFDQTGSEFDVEIKFDEDDIKIIESYGVLV